ncbi:hypothetical protein T4B_6313 [Trichinella pseudospiralis]|uniref:Uncharacterized protein n=1 Tax=Trichinella pseudospiralis TaxID=6337 RepID=A0A0V1HSS5_TRIPS|nr:hypothetical protein T4A_10783 [Trichinella pseudospiralis]KRZ13122.1 hypothetical protein T4B_6313 [Trichinella pseudospiralis]KRZ32126.1 hypothetical protein T4C_11753 [Trichinella pseudospiralis]
MYIRLLENECRLGDVYHHTSLSEDLAETTVNNNQASMWRHCPTEDNPSDMLSRGFEQHSCSLKKLEYLDFERN